MEKYSDTGLLVGFLKTFTYTILLLQESSSTYFKREEIVVN